MPCLINLKAVVVPHEIQRLSSITEPNVSVALLLQNSSSSIVLIDLRRSRFSLSATRCAWMLWLCFALFCSSHSQATDRGANRLHGPGRSEHNAAALALHFFGFTSSPPFRKAQRDLLQPLSFFALDRIDGRLGTVCACWRALPGAPCEGERIRFADPCSLHSWRSDAVVLRSLLGFIRWTGHCTSISCRNSDSRRTSCGQTCLVISTDSPPVTCSSTARARQHRFLVRCAVLVLLIRTPEILHAWLEETTCTSLLPEPR